MALNPLLQVLNLTTQLLLDNRAVTVIDKISFTLYPGKTLALVGESGCGKSLTALSIMRILPEGIALPPTGKVLYKGKNLLALTEKEMRKIRGAKIAMIFQDPVSALNPLYTIGDQLLEVVALHLDLDEEAAIKRILQLLEEVGISNPEKTFACYPHQLSGGMKQRVMIAMALICEPDILIADEPTTALDVTIQAQILQLIKQLQKKHHMALLLITHDIDVVADIADDVMVMYASEVMEKGSLSEVFEKKSHPYTQGLFASRPTAETPRGHLKAIPGTVPNPSDYPSGCKFHPRCPFVMEKCKLGTIGDYKISHEETSDKDPHTAKCVLYE